MPTRYPGQNLVTGFSKKRVRDREELRAPLIYSPETKVRGQAKDGKTQWGAKFRVVSWSTVQFREWYQILGSTG